MATWIPVRTLGLPFSSNMAYHVYTTPGMVLKGVPTGEADKYFYILTEDLGLIIANAKSVRKSESKLASGLEDFSFGTFTFVKGKHSWKITGVDPKENMYRYIRHSDSRVVLVNFLVLIRRLVNGESIHKELYTIAKGLYGVLASQKHSKERLFALESLATLRLLFELGYVHADDIYTEILRATSFSETDILLVIKHQKKILQDINNALKESQL